MLAKKAGESGMCEADYLRLLISQKPNDYPEVRELLKELINEVNRIGININQIVFNNNAGLYSKEDKTQLVAYMRKLNKKVNEAVVQIGKKDRIQQRDYKRQKRAASKIGCFFTQLGGAYGTKSE